MNRNSSEVMESPSNPAFLYFVILWFNFIFGLNFLKTGSLFFESSLKILNRFFFNQLSKKGIFA